MRPKRRLHAWIWPPPPIASRLWLAILIAMIYSLVVYFAAYGFLDKLPSWSSEFGLVNGLVLGVLVAIRVRAAFDRWFEGQKLWAELTTHARNLAIKIAHIIDAEPNERRQSQQWISAFPFALVRRLRGDDPSIQGLPEVDLPQPRPAHVPSFIAGRLGELAAKWRQTGKLDGPGLWAVEANIRQMMDVTGQCERIVATPVPQSFHALLRHGLALSLLLAPWHLIHTLGLWALPVQAIIIYFLFGIELTAEEIENPFGTDVDDLPLIAYCESIRRDVDEIFGEPPSAARVV